MIFIGKSSIDFLVFSIRRNACQTTSDNFFPLSIIFDKHSIKQIPMKIITTIDVLSWWNVDDKLLALFCFGKILWMIGENCRSSHLKTNANIFVKLIEVEWKWIFALERLEWCHFTSPICSTMHFYRRISTEIDNFLFKQLIEEDCRLTWRHFDRNFVVEENLNQWIKTLPTSFLETLTSLRIFSVLDRHQQSLRTSHRNFALFVHLKKTFQGRKQKEAQKLSSHWNLCQLKRFFFITLLFHCCFHSLFIIPIKTFRYFFMERFICLNCQIED